MAQIKKKFIEDNAVNQDKIRLDNDTFLRARNNADNADVDIVKIDSSDRIQFDSVPQVSADPAAANDLVRKSYVDGQTNGLNWKESARAATTANITLATAPATIDGVSMAVNDRVLVKDQTTASENGIYQFNGAGSAMTRTEDADSPSDILQMAVFVQEGTANADKGYVLTTDAPITLGVTSLSYVQFSSAGLTEGDGINITGGVISVDHDGEGLTFSGGQLALELDGSTLAKTATGLEVADAGITEVQINSSAAGNGLTGGSGSALAVEADTTETSTTLASSVNVAATGLSIRVDDSTLEGSGQGVAGAEDLRVKDAGITETQIASSALGNGLKGGSGTALAVEPADIAGSGLEDDGADNLQINVDATNSSTKINGSNELEAVKASGETITLNGTDISNQYIDLAQPAHSAAAIQLIPEGGPEQTQGTDYTVSLTGGAGGVTRLSFAGDLASGGAAALANGDVLLVKYSYL